MRAIANVVLTLAGGLAGVRVFIGDSDRHEGRPLYKVLVERAHAMGVAGATVLQGPLGFGRHSRMHTAKLAGLSSDLPVVIELVDAPAVIQGFMAEVDALVQEGLVTLETVRIVRYTPGG